MRAPLVALMLLAGPAIADEVALADLPPDAVAALVDVTSFPNSTGPRREDGLRTWADYGFTEVTVVDGTAELREPDGSWMFAVTVLSTEGERAVLCVLDRALGGPSYHTQDAKVFALADGMLVATRDEVSDPRCETSGSESSADGASRVCARRKSSPLHRLRRSPSPASRERLSRLRASRAGHEHPLPL